MTMAATRTSTWKRSGAALALAALLAGVSACGDSDKSAGSAADATPSAAASTAAPRDSAADQAEITKAFVTFFNSKTPADQAVALLENGSKHAAVLNKPDPAGSPLITAKVTSVKVSGDTADVVWDVLGDGRIILPGKESKAVRVDGTWKVEEASYCQLISLGNGGKPTPECVGVA